MWLRHLGKEGQIIRNCQAAKAENQFPLCVYVDF